MNRLILSRFALLAVLSPLLFMANSCPEDPVSSDPVESMRELEFLNATIIPDRKVKLEFNTPGDSESVTFRYENDLGRGSWFTTNVTSYTENGDTTSVIWSGTVEEIFGFTFRGYLKGPGERFSDYFYVTSNKVSIGLPAPSDLTAEFQNNDDPAKWRVQLSWVDHSDSDDGFLVSRGDPSGNWTLMRSETNLVTAPNMPKTGGTYTWVDSTITGSDTLYYKVQAMNWTYSAKSQASNIDTVYTPEDPRGSLVAPSNLTASEGLEYVHLEWSDNSDNEEGFIIERGMDTDESFIEVARTDANVTTFDYTGQHPWEVNDTYQVRAYAGGIVSETSNWAHGLITVAAPTNVTVVFNDPVIVLNWTDNSSIESGYMVYSRFANSSVLNEAGTVGANVTTFSDNQIIGYDQPILYSVSTQYNNQSASYSENVDITIPSKPSDLTAMVNGSSVDLSWSDNSTAEDGYIVERKTGTGNFATLTTLSANAESYSDPSPPTGSVTYRVGTTLNSVVNHSGEASIMIDPPPAAPSNLMATVNGLDVDLSWTDNSDNETGFMLERKVGSDAFTLLNYENANATTYTDMAPPQGVLLSYRVTAGNLTATSNPSNVASATVPVTIIAPSNLNATLNGSDVDLTWSDNSDNEDGFIIIRDVNGAGYTTLDMVSPNTASYTDLAPPADSDVSYRVFAYLGANNSDTTSAAMVHTPTSGGSGGVVFSDDFSSYTSGFFPDSPSWSFLPDVPFATNAFVSEYNPGDQVLVATDDSSGVGGGAYINLDFPDVVDGSFEMDVLFETGFNANASFGIMLGFDGTVNVSESNLAAFVRFYSDGINAKMYIDNGSGWDSTSIAELTNYHLKITWNLASGYQVFLDDVQVGGTIPFYGGHTGSSISGMSIKLFDDTYLWNAVFDNVVVTDGTVTVSSFRPAIKQSPRVAKAALDRIDRRMKRTLPSRRR